MGQRAYSATRRLQPGDQAGDRQHHGPLPRAEQRVCFQPRDAAAHSRAVRPVGQHQFHPGEQSDSRDGAPGVAAEAGEQIQTLDFGHDAARIVFSSRAGGMKKGN